MNDVDPLLIAEENAAFWADRYVAIIAAANAPNGTHYTELAFRHHLLAIVHLLRDGNERAFAEFSCRAAQAQLALLRHAAAGATVHPACTAASEALPFADALAAGALDIARELAALTPATPAVGFEYEDDFLRFHFLHRLLLAPDDPSALEAVLARWDVVRQRKRCPYRDVSAALLQRDADAFDDAMQSVIERRRDTLAEFRSASDYDRELDVTEGNVFVHGLALLRLAELRGVATRDEYDFMPGLARIPLGTPLPAAEAWRAGSRT